MQEPLGEADASRLGAQTGLDARLADDDELRRAAPDVDHERARGERPVAADPVEGEAGLLLAGEEPRREAVAPLDLTEERLAVVGVADGAGAHREHSLRTERFHLAAVVDEDVPHPRDRGGEEDASPV